MIYFSWELNWFMVADIFEKQSAVIETEFMAFLFSNSNWGICYHSVWGGFELMSLKRSFSSEWMGSYCEEFLWANKASRAAEGRQAVGGSRIRTFTRALTGGLSETGQQSSCLYSLKQPHFQNKSYLDYLLPLCFVFSSWSWTLLISSKTIIQTVEDKTC